jgi:hypothetical protein
MGTIMSPLRSPSRSTATNEPATGDPEPKRSAVEDWLQRVEVEYREMPGLRLTERQMRRLWGFDTGMCALLIAALVSSGFLFETPHGYALAAAPRTTRR